MTPEEIIKRFDKLDANRGVFKTHWQECADYAQPFKDQIMRQSTPGEKKGARLFDSTAILASDLLCSALHGMLTNPTTPWFELTTGDETLDSRDDVKGWLQDSARRMHTTLNSSNFQTEVHEIYQDLTVPGTAGISIEEDDEVVVRFQARHVREFVVEEDSKGRINRVYRKFKWKPDQILEFFGEKGMDPEILDMLQKNLDTEFEIIHAIYPRNLAGLPVEKRAIPTGFPYASKYVLCKKKYLLRESGFKEWPMPIPRWSKVTGEIYGRSPTMKCLADIKMVNRMMEAVIKGAQKTVDPAMMAPDEGIIGGVLRTTPGSVTYFRSGTNTDTVKPILNDARIDFGYQAVEDVRKRIREAFFVDQLQLQQGPQMTATEVNTRTEEKMRLLGPVLARQQAEFLDPLIERVFQIMLRKGKISPFPEVLKGKKIAVRYSSMIARAQRIAEGQNVARVINLLAPIASMDPTVMDILNSDDYAKYIADIHGLPEKILRNADDLKKIRDARATNNQQQQQFQAEQHQADLAAKIGPAAAKAKIAGLI